MHLYIKTVERAHSPKNLWEKIYLSRNYAKALAQLDEHLQYFPKAQIHRNKQRLTKIHQYLLRMRKLKLRQINGTKSVKTRIHRKVEQREERREKKALVAAKIENSIEKELVERLARGTYGDIYNFPEVPYQKALEEVEKQGEEEEEMESEEELEVSNSSFTFCVYVLPKLVSTMRRMCCMLMRLMAYFQCVPTANFHHHSVLSLSCIIRRKMRPVMKMA